MTETLEVTTALALHWAVHRSKRCVPVVGSATHPTPWDVAHRDIDRRLYEMQAEESARIPARSGL